MAVRQYIGARYVLKIYENSQDPQSAEWEAGVSYEPLTMVNYNNSSYISRKDVPATVGNPVANPSYWALSGLYNGQIANLQQQVNELTDDVRGMENTTAKNIYAGKSVIRKNLVQKPDYLKTLADTVENCSLQGAAYNSTRNTYLIAILEDSGLVVHLVEISMSDGITVVTRKTFGDHILGHANDITYNPNTNMYYVCTLANGNVNNEAAAIDADTLDIVETIQLYPNTTIEAEGSLLIAYDEENDRYFSMSQYAIYVYDKDFNMIKTIDYPLVTGYISTNFGYSQGVVNAICAYKGYVCLGIFGWDSPNEAGIILALVDVESSETFTTWNIESNSTYEELEGLFVKGEDIYMISGQMFYNVSRIIVQGHPTFDKEKAVYGGGKHLYTGDNLDTVYAPGKYYVDAAVTNNPMTTQCKMTVEYFGTICIQTLWTLASDRESKLYRYNSGQTWSAWQYVTTAFRDEVPIEIPVSYFTTVGIFIASATEIDFTLTLRHRMSNVFATGLTVSGYIACRIQGKFIADGVTTAQDMSLANLAVTPILAGDGHSVTLKIKRADGLAFRDTNGNSLTSYINYPVTVTTSGSFKLIHSV